MDNDLRTIHSFIGETVVKLISRVVALILLGGGAAICQLLPFHSYTIENGLPCNAINTLYQDSRGFIWIGTEDGVSMYDGRTFSSYTMIDGMASNYVINIVEDRASPGTMYIATLPIGLSKWKNGKVSIVEMGRERWLNRVNGMAQDEEGTFWCATESCAVTLRNDSISILRTPREVYDAGLVAIGADGLVWFRCFRDIVCYSRKDSCWTTVYKADTWENRPTEMLVDRRGTIWVPLWSGSLLKIVGKAIVARYKLPTGGVTFLVDDVRGNLWFASYDGLFTVPKDSISPPHVVHYTSDNGLPENRIVAGLVDREDNLWVGGVSKGVFKLAEKGIIRLPFEKLGPPSHHLFIATADSNDHIWVMNDEGTLREFWQEVPGDPTHWHQSSHRVSRSGVDGIPYSLFCDFRGRLWIGFLNGDLVCYDVLPRQGRGSDLRPERSILSGVDLPKAFPGCFLVDHDGFVWYGLFYVGLALLDPAKDKPLIRIFGEADSVPPNHVWALYEDRFGTIWAGTFRDGVVRLPAGERLEGSFHTVPLPEVPYPRHINSIRQDGRDRIWVGSSSGGVIVLDKDTRRAITLGDGLPSNKVMTITADHEGMTWLGTRMGMVCLEERDSLIFHRKGEFLGYPVFASGTTRSGLLWFLSPERLTIYDAAAARRDPAPPPVFVTRFVVGGHDVGFTDQSTLSFMSDNCIVDFIGISYRDEHAIRYRYMLAGIDRGWSPLAENTSVTYAALKPGTYSFLVKAVDGQGTESSKPAAVTFTIIPHLWERWWFSPLVGFILVGIAAGAIRRRMLTLRREKSMQQEFSRRLMDSHEEERKRIAHELHDSLGQDLILIKNRAVLGLGGAGNTAEHLTEISSLASQSIDEVRAIAHNLHPYQLDRLGLTRAIRSIITRVSASSSIRFSANIATIDALLPKESEIHVFRIVQEAVNNIVKHSEASEADVVIEATDSSLRLTMKDNGKGFDPASSSTGERGFGLRGIAERADILKGDFSVASSPGKGTTLSFTIPVHTHHNDL